MPGRYRPSDRRQSSQRDDCSRHAALAIALVGLIGTVWLSPKHMLRVAGAGGGLLDRIDSLLLALAVVLLLR
jgi:predicted CDP-diglyceride synthetase/phosphatidate cytidylyltransferase